MKRLFTTLALLAAALPARAAPARQLVEWKLDNGLAVVYLGVHRAPLVSVQVFYHVGSKDDPKGLRGLAHMFERLFFKGTRFVPPDQQARMIGALGGKLDAQSQEDYTAFVDTVPRADLDFAVRLEADRMRNLVVRKEVVDAERRVAKNELRARLDGSPVARGSERFRRTAYTVHPYAGWPLGQAEDLDRIQPADVQRFYDTYYRPNNAVLVVVGDVSEDEVRVAATRWFGPLERGAEPPRPSAALVEPPQTQEHRETVGGSPLGLVMTGYHIPAARSDDLPILQVLWNIVAAGDGARLPVRITRKDASGVYAGGQLLVTEEPGLFVVYGVFTSPEAAAKVDDGLADELGRLAREPVGDAELIRARNQLAAGAVFGGESVEATAAQLGASKILTGDAKRWLVSPERYQAVTAADVQRVAKQVLVPENRTVIVMPPTPPQAPAATPATPAAPATPAPAPGKEGGQ
jgi:zinc protease